MTNNHHHDELPLLFTLDDLVNACAWDKAWVMALMNENVITPSAPTGDSATYFNSVQLTQVRRAARLRRDFDASPQAIALIMSLLEELRPLRQLQRQVSMTRVIQDVDWQES